MRVLVAGSRQATAIAPIYRELTELFQAWLENPEINHDEGFTVVHGGAPGADTIAGQWAWDNRGTGMISVEVHLADWRQHGNIAGNIRNHEMVRLSADVVLGFPQAGAANRGTHHCLEEAKRWLGHTDTIIKETWLS